MNDEPLPPPPALIRQLSEHHWFYAQEELFKNKQQVVTAGRVYDIDDGSIVWEYYLVRNVFQLEKHTISNKYNIYDIQIVRQM